MKRYHVSARAKIDLAQIWSYIARRNRRAARNVARGIIDRYRLLARFPGIGQRRDDLRPGIRTFPVGNYLIVYRAISDGVEIVRVLHGARDIGAVLDEEA